MEVLLEVNKLTTYFNDKFSTLKTQGECCVCAAIPECCCVVVTPVTGTPGRVTLQRIFPSSAAPAVQI